VKLNPALLKPTGKGKYVTRTTTETTVTEGTVQEMRESAE